jgi:PAS domain-containing protein
MSSQDQSEQMSGGSPEVPLSNKDRLRAVLEASLDAIITINERGTILAFAPPGPPGG